jgi:5-hydroxyisourate hydrolase-like protein (transthyretin family)/thiol-disulfide isomerase/thioredoxin
LDLSAFAIKPNGLVSDSWSVLPRGTQSMDGVIFVIDGRLEVTGLAAARSGDFSPDRISGIPVGRKATRLFLLHGASGPEEAGVPIAQLVLHYTDGTRRALRLAYGVHVSNSFPERGERTNRLADTKSKLAWTGRRDESDRFSGNLVHLFRTEIENPLPDQEIASIDFVSFFSRATPFIVAVTLEENGPVASSAPSPPPGRLGRKAYKFDDDVYRGQFLIQALDAATGRPLDNATANLTITDDELSFYLGEGRADAQGRIALDYPPQHTVAYTLLVKAPGHLPVILTDSKLKTRHFETQLTARLERGVSVGGIVRTATGEPIAEAEVVLYKVKQEGPREFTRVDYGTAKTDSTGRWSSSAVPTNFSGFSFQLTHPEYQAGLFTDTAGPGATNLVEHSALLAGKAIMTLQPASRVRGFVNDSQGHPVPNAELYLQPQNRSENRSAPRRVATTDNNGSFAFTDTESGERSLFILAEGFTPRFQQAGLGTERGEPVHIVLNEARPVTGFVRDQYQQPIPGAVVRVDNWHETPLLKWRAVTDEQGRFVWNNPPEDSVLLYVTKTNYSSMRTMVSGAQGELNFMLQRRSQIVGRVVDADTGEPIPEFKVIRGRAYSPYDPIRWERYNATRARNGQFSISLNDYYGSEGRSQMMVEAPGYIPQTSPPLTRGGSHTNNFALKRGKGLSGVVKLPNGEPVANASVVLVDKTDAGYMDRPGQFQRSSSVDLVQTDSSGRFEFQPRLDSHSILAAHDKGFAQVRAEAVSSNGVITLMPWGRVTGTLRVGETPGANQTIQLQTMYYRYGEEGRIGSSLSLYLNTETDNDGNFVFDKVPPGERKISIRYKFRENRSGPTPLSHGLPLTVLPGANTNVIIGGTGRPVIGRVKVTTGNPQDVDWLRDVHTLTMRAPEPPGLGMLRFDGAVTPEEQARRREEFEKRQREFWNSPAGRVIERDQRTYVLLFETNGSFHIDDVPPGQYQLEIAPTDAEQDYYNYSRIGSLVRQVTIPEALSGKPYEPFDLGTLQLAIRTRNRPGGRAPSFEVTTFEGKTIKFDDFRGKYVLLDFWATWAGSRQQDLLTLTNVYANFGASNQFVMISLNLDFQREIGEAFLKTNALPWLQCHAGEQGNNVLLPSFGLDGLPANVLIDPQGRIQSRNLRGTSLLNTVRRVLSSATTGRSAE